MTRRLLIRPGGIGDCIVSFPALEFLKADYTEVWISSSVVPLVQFADCVRAISSTQLDLVGVIEFPERLAERLRAFDEVITWYGTNRPEFRQEMTQVQPRCTFLSALPESEPAVDFYLRQVSGPLGLVPRIQVDPFEQRRSVVIHPFSGSAKKNWPLEKYRELAQRLPAEWADNRFDNLMDLASWMRGARVYIGNDSGISHLAAAIGLPSVVLFGPTDPLIWAPRGDNVRILHHQPLSQLPVDEVLKYCLDGMPDHHSFMQR